MVDHPDVKKILDNTIILLVPSLNPDGVDIVKNWYDKTLGTPFEGTDPPELYHKYVGHDNNRDWYAFTQVETQLTVDKIHNVWHPQIVHDIHQQGQFGSRLFLPPYMQPVEPNVPKQIVEGYTELGNYMAESMRKIGYQGITTNSTYDAWTPARAYSHYHGGVRILSETASARLATPVNIKFENLRVAPDDGYDPKVESPNFGPVWKGGEWKLRNITDTMTTAANALLMHAANNREKWLTRFYEIGKEAVRPRKDGELNAIVLPRPKAGENGNAPLARHMELIAILERGGVETRMVGKTVSNGVTFPDGSTVISLSQPYGQFAKALLERQEYPNLLSDKGEPIPPYDVTSHSLSLLMEVDAAFVKRRVSWSRAGSNGYGRGCDNGDQEMHLFKSHVPAMDEGWTRWLLGEADLETGCAQFRVISTTNENIRSLDYLVQKRPPVIGSSKIVDDDPRFASIIFPDQSPNQILNGYPKGSMPDEYTGGVGKEGVENLKKFVEAGGTLVFLNRSSDFAIREFNLPIKNVTAGLARKDFYIPGSILRTELDLTSPIAKGMPQQSIAWFENSPVFELSEPPALAGGTTAATSKPPTNAGGSDIRVIARYPSDSKQILLSGWALGAEKIAGKAALVEVTMGKGKIILFGFRPQYRGQSLATFPLLFNAISQ